MNPVDLLFELLERQGGSAYLGEPVTQKEHALQTAALAAREGASAALVAAALLHDIGHLLPDAESAGGLEHEQRAAAWLARFFGPEITEAVRLHVAAKRYLCATEPGYFERLSPASVESLALQGGPFSPAEAREFERNPYYQEAVCLRRWDEEAKTPGAVTPGLETYRCIVEQALKDNGEASPD